LAFTPLRISDCGFERQSAIRNPKSEIGHATSMGLVTVNNGK
jgi:hypothetical protein